jgi:large subunit ribosomal protein L18
MNKQNARERRGLKAKIRIKLSGRPRLVVHRSGMHIYSQIMLANESGDVVMAQCSSIDKEIASKLKGKNKVDQATMVCEMLAKRAKDKGISQVAFDRAGYKYHGRVKALAAGAREAGLDF